MASVDPKMMTAVASMIRIKCFMTACSWLCLELGAQLGEPLPGSNLRMSWLFDRSFEYCRKKRQMIPAASKSFSGWSSGSPLVNVFPCHSCPKLIIRQTRTSFPPLESVQDTSVITPSGSERAVPDCNGYARSSLKLHLQTISHNQFSCACANPASWFLDNRTGYSYIIIYNSSNRIYGKGSGGIDHKHYGGVWWH